MELSGRKLSLAALYSGLVALCLAILPETSGPIWLAVLFLILALPSGMFTLYLATLRRTHWLSMWEPDSFAVRWLSGPWLRLIFGILVAFMSAFLLSLRLSVAGWIDLTLLVISGVAFGLALIVFGKWLRSQYQPLYRQGRPLFWTAVIAAGLMCLLDPALRFLIGGYATYETLPEAIYAAQEQASWLGGSAVASLLAGLASIWVGFDAYVFGRLVEDPGFGAWFGLLMSGLFRFPLYFVAGLTICAFVLPSSEYQRIVLPVHPDEEIQPVSPERIAWASASTTIVIFFIYFPLVAVLETTVEQRPSMQAPEEAVVQAVELISGQYYEVGTVEEINHLAISMIDESAEELALLDFTLENGFSMMRDNIDNYLDWYYSLPGEWARVANLLRGNAEEYLVQRLSEELLAGDPFAVFEKALEVAIPVETQRQEEFEELALALLDSRRVEIAHEEEVEVVARADQEALISLSAHSEFSTLESRLGVTIATSGISGILAAVATRQILSRIAARGTIRAAAAALARLATIRAGAGGGGAAAGAAVGGTIGSVFPGVGTAIGAAIGGVVGGVSAGVGAEYLIIKLEELVSRENHHNELLAAIDEAEFEVRQYFTRTSQP